MSHRILLAADAAMTGRTPGIVLEELLQQVPVPIRDRA
jgi:hypothetical protein